jgi:hypothetical protein
MALVDADYKFLWVEVGCNGGASDAQLFLRCDLRDMIDDDALGIPAPEPLPGDDRNMPYFLVADDAFALKTWLMKPFAKRNMPDSERIFNYRLSRARRIVENAFGILAQRFGCLLTTMRQQPEAVSNIVLACCTLHNLLRIRYPVVNIGLIDAEDNEHHLVPGAWRNGVNMHDMENVAGGNLATKVAKRQRLYLTHYYNSPAGAVHWQNGMI